MKKYLILAILFTCVGAAARPQSCDRLNSGAYNIYFKGSCFYYTWSLSKSFEFIKNICETADWQKIRIVYEQPNRMRITHQNALTSHYTYFTIGAKEAMKRLVVVGSNPATRQILDLSESNDDNKYAKTEIDYLLDVKSRVLPVASFGYFPSNDDRLAALTCAIDALSELL